MLLYVAGNDNIKNRKSGWAMIDSDNNFVLQGTCSFCVNAGELTALAYALAYYLDKNNNEKLEIVYFDKETGEVIKNAPNLKKKDNPEYEENKIKIKNLIKKIKNEQPSSKTKFSISRRKIENPFVIKANRLAQGAWEKNLKIIGFYL